MKKMILAISVFASSAAFACPNLEGEYNFSSSSSLSVSQNQGVDGVTTYKMTIDDHNCAICKYDRSLRADGKTVRREFSATSRVESTTITCEDNRVKFRQTTDTYGGNGEIITSYSDNFDYRINSDDSLVEEVIREGAPASKTVYTRIQN